MTDQLDKEIARLDSRKQKFIQEGLCEEQAFILASAMFDRDRDPQDDRRVCFECENYVGRVCMEMRDRYGKPQMPLRFVLQRCPDFKLKGKK